MDVTIRDKIKQKIFSKDWVASSKLASIYIQDPNRTWDQDLQQMIQMGVFSDYHCYRPYEKFKHINDTIVSWL